MDKKNNRLIGKYGNPQSEILIICTAGMHGNEPAGIQALEQVLEHLQENNTKLNAYIICFKGNLAALEQKQRYIHQDLNRIWNEESLSLAKQNSQSNQEYCELVELYQEIEETNYQHYSKRIYLDLHTTSAKNGVFLITPNLKQTESILQNLKAPIILGLEQKLEGTSMKFWQEKGFLSFVFEGGQHTTQKAICNIEWLIWNVFLALGSIESETIPEEVAAYEHLNRISEKLPAILTLKYLHKIQKGDNFKMKVGFQNFDKVHKGDLLAKDIHGEIQAPEDAYLLMPLYQSEGNDGFFLVA